MTTNQYLLMLMDKEVQSFQTQISYLQGDLDQAKKVIYILQQRLDEANKSLEEIKEIQVKLNEQQQNNE